MRISFDRTGRVTKLVSGRTEVKDSNEWLLWVALGSILGFSGIGLLGMSPFIFSDPNFVGKYDAIIGSFLALLAAGFAFYGLLVQIENSNAIEQDRLFRRERAARALLPFALNQITEYADNCIHLIENNLPDPMNEWNADVDAPHSLPTGYSLPVFPNESLDILKDCVESISSEPAARVAELMNKLQVHKARFEGFCRKYYADDDGRSITVFTLHNLIRHVTDALMLRARCELLFPYARQKASAVNCLTREDVLRSALLLNLDTNDESTLCQQINLDFAEPAE